MEHVLKEMHVDLIDGRIKHLEAVIFRSRQRQRQRHQNDHTRVQVTNIAGEVLTKGDNVQEEKVGIEVDKQTMKCEKMCKRKASYLVAKALCKSFYDCNICLNKASDPVLTCCGHLFCWRCFYQLSYEDVNAKECPVCLGEVSEIDLIPIYGNASVDGSDRSELKESSSTIPPRPRAARIESIRHRSRIRTAIAMQDLLLLRDFDGLEEPHKLEI